jgi:hypothetical protein
VARMDGLGRHLPASVRTDDGGVIVFEPNGARRDRRPRDWATTGFVRIPTRVVMTTVPVPPTRRLVSSPRGGVSRRAEPLDLACRQRCSSERRRHAHCDVGHSADVVPCRCVSSRITARRPVHRAPNRRILGRCRRKDSAVFR